jgi:tetratricopeptide (TPR) repeat protein
VQCETELLAHHPGEEAADAAGKVEVCRLLCLSSARMNRQHEFQKGMSLLRTWADDSWARSNVHFLLGFNARLDGNLPLAETHLREAYRESPGNFSAIRELAAICVIWGELDQAETFARKAIETASDNPYILDILLSALITCPRNKLREREPEIAHLFEKLKTVGEEEGRSFYTTRVADYQLKLGNIHEASRMIDAAATKTPGIFDIHALRAKIYLERGIKAIVSDEIEKMRRVVYHESAGERHTKLYITATS